MKMVILQGVTYNFALIYTAKPVFINMHNFIKAVTHHKLCCF